MDALQYYGYKEEKKHTPDSFPYNVYPCTIPLDFPDVPLHWHDEAEIIAVKKGRGQVSVDMVTRTLKAGDIVLILPGQLHAISTDEVGSLHAFEYENIIFERRLLASADSGSEVSKTLAPFLFPDSSVSTDGQRLPTFITGEQSVHDELFSLIEETDAVCEKKAAGWQLMVQANLLRFFYTLIQHLPDLPDPDVLMPARNLDILRRITGYAADHLTDKITIAQMAELTGFSQTHFIRFFKQCTGLHFTEWLNRYRLSMAARILVMSNEPITEVAAEAGFGNLSYFNRTFRSKYGMTPREYRKRNT